MEGAGTGLRLVCGGVGGGQIVEGVGRHLQRIIRDKTAQMRDRGRILLLLKISRALRVAHHQALIAGVVELQTLFLHCSHAARLFD
jgi:hypothetical protein